MAITLRKEISVFTLKCFFFFSILCMLVLKIQSVTRLNKFLQIPAYHLVYLVRHGYLDPMNPVSFFIL